MLRNSSELEDRISAIESLALKIERELKELLNKVNSLEKEIGSLREHINKLEGELNIAKTGLGRVETSLTNLKEESERVAVKLEQKVAELRNELMGELRRLESRIKWMFGVFVMT